MPQALLDGRFQIKDRIAKIANGEVFRGHDLQTDLPVVVRVLRPEVAGSVELLTRFQREANLLRNLNHPNAETVVGTGLTDNNSFYVVLEQVPGRTLAQVLRDNGPIPPHQLADYLDQIAAVLDSAHARQMIHRDVKPEHIKVYTDEAGNEVVKLLGFTFAKAVGDLPPGVAVTQPGMVVGSPTYMSPEQATGATVLKHSDIYSLGVALYELLTGALPFQERSPLKTMLAHVSAAIPAFSARNPNHRVPTAVEQVVCRAMAKDLVDRPGSVGELARMFREALAATEPFPSKPLGAAGPETIVVAPSATPRTGPTRVGVPLQTVLIFGAVFAAAVLLGVMAALLVEPR